MLITAFKFFNYWLNILQTNSVGHSILQKSDDHSIICFFPHLHHLFAVAAFAMLNNATFNDPKVELCQVWFNLSSHFIIQELEGSLTVIVHPNVH